MLASCFKPRHLRLLATLTERGEVIPGVPSLAVAQLALEVNRALNDSTLRTALEAQGFRVTGGTPQQMGAAMESAASTWQIHP